MANTANGGEINKKNSYQEDFNDFKQKPIENRPKNVRC